MRNRLPDVGSLSALAKRLPARSSPRKNADVSGSLIAISPADAPTCISQMQAVDGQALAIVARTLPNVTVDMPEPPNAVGTTARSSPDSCSATRLATGISADSSYAAAVVGEAGRQLVGGVEPVLLAAPRGRTGPAGGTAGRSRPIGAWRRGDGRPADRRSGSRT